MNNSSIILAQIALSELQPESFREEIIQGVLEYRKKAAPELRALLERSFNKSLRVPGFKHPIKAPVKTVARQAAAHLFCCPGVLQSVLEIWVESHEKLRQVVARNIKQPSLALNAIFVLEDDQPVGWTAQMTELIQSAKLEVPASEDEIALMICCLIDVVELRVLNDVTLRNENGRDAEPSDALEPAYPKVKSGDEEPEVKTPLFVECLNKLAKLSADAAEWDELELFHSAAAQMRSRTMQTEREKIERAVRQFAESNRDHLRFFGVRDSESWSAEIVFPGNLFETESKLAVIAEAMAQHASLTSGISESLIEARRQRDELARLEDQIVRLLADLKTSTEFDAESVSAHQPKLQATESLSADPRESDDVSSERAVVGTPFTPPHTPGNGQTLPIESSPATLSTLPIDTEEAPVVDEVITATEEGDLEKSPLDSPVSVAPQAQTDLADTKETDKVDPPAIPADVTQTFTEPLLTSAPLVEELIEPQVAYSFTADLKSADIASLILQRPDRERVSLRDLVWRLVFEGHLGLAFYLGRSLEAIDANGGQVLPAWLIAAVAYAPHLRFTTGEIARSLSEEFDRFSDTCFVTNEPDWDLAVLMLCGAAAMRPALLAPGTKAASILRRLPAGPDLKSLHKYWQSIADFGDGRQALEPDSLKSVRDKTVWQAELDALVREVRDWSARAPRFQISVPRALRVWRTWQDNGQLINSLLAPVVQNDAGKIEIAKALVERWSKESEVRREIDITDRQLLRRPPREDIGTRAMVYLWNHVRTALNFTRRWIQLQESGTGNVKNFSQQKAERLSREILSGKAQVKEELLRLTSHHRSFFVETSARILHLALQDLWALLDSTKRISIEESDAKHILNGDLLKSPLLKLNHSWEPLGSPEEVIEGVLEVVANNDLSWRDVIKQKGERLDHEETGWIVEYVEGREGPAFAEPLRQLRKTQIAESRAHLEKETKLTRNEIRNALAFGLLTEKEHVDLSDRVKQIESRTSAGLNFGELLAELGDVREEIIAKRKREVDTIIRRLEEANITPTHPAFARIAGAMERGDTSVANEYLALGFDTTATSLRQARPNVFRDFFPATFRTVEEFLNPQRKTEVPHVSQLVKSLRRYGTGEIDKLSIGPINLDQVKGEQAIRAAEMLETWFTIKQAADIDSVGAKTILNNLGFDSVERTKYTQNGRRWMSVITEKLEDRDRCPIPTFGSEAKGQYRVLCVWDKPTAESLMDLVGDNSKGSQIIVFYFGVLTEQSRRELARRSRKRLRTFLVIDDILILYLCGKPEPRIKPMFECTLPFTFDEPYKESPGHVPVEMFYGRERERRSIVEPMESCFIYGGRQLGKTVLLRDVERRFRGQQDNVVCWFDIQANGFGRGKRFEEMWASLAARLQDDHGLPMGVRQSRHINLDRFLESVDRWLDEQPNRTLLLLLDEADDFLVYDGTRPRDAGVHTGGFPISTRLKGAMDRNGRRFKVVFAGLHNVQRTTRLANHPLAHYGESLCIGPLLAHGEWHEAQDLITVPLAALGYYFESPELVDQILWQTNYYPSLIQLYCKYLLRQVRLESLLDAQGPPYLITERQVRQAYLNDDLRKAVREKLKLTLELDRRYEVIAYTIALETITDKERSTMEGFSVPWIKKEVMSWWPEGFRSSDSEDSIRALLSEMVGLGILREMRSGRFGFRSTNISLLIGTEEEDVQAALLENREVPPEYEAATFRAPLLPGGTAEALRFRSPLTDQQESELVEGGRGVSIIIGCDASGLADVEVRLKSLFGVEGLVNIDGTADRARFDRILSDLADRGRERTTLVYVPQTCPWSGLWISEAIQRVKRLIAARSPVRIVFVAGPNTTWQIINDENPSLRSLIEEGGLNPIHLRPLQDAALRQWLNDLQFASNQRTRLRINQVTGNWPLLVNRLFDLSRSESLALNASFSKLEAELADPETARKLLDSWGLNNPEALRVINYLTTGEVTASDLTHFVEGLEIETINRRLAWADRLGIVRSRGNERWELDPTIGQLLTASVSESRVQARGASPGPDFVS